MPCEYGKNDFSRFVVVLEPLGKRLETKLKLSRRDERSLVFPSKKVRYSGIFKGMYL